MDMFILIFVLSFISVISACIFHWWKERLKNKDAESVNYVEDGGVKDSRHSYGFTKEKAEVISVATREAYLEQYPAARTYTRSWDLDTSWMQKEINDVQEKWKQSTPKHKTRIKNRSKRLSRKRNKGGKK